MPVERLMPWLALSGMGAIAAMVALINIGLDTLIFPVAFGFSAAVIALTMHSARALWALPRERVTPKAAPAIARRHALLMALIYGWGAIAMVALYGLTPLRWQHWLQYAGGMMLIAALIAAYASAVAKPGSALADPRWLYRTMQLTLVQAIAATGGLAWLIASGKAASAKPDWAANAVFMAGGIAIAIISALAVLIQRHMTRRT